MTTPRERFDLIEQRTPTLANNQCALFASDLNAHGRPVVPGHRTEITPARLTQALPEMLTGSMGLAPQIHAYRRVSSIKTRAKGVWKKATQDILTDLAQCLDPVLTRARAQRIADDAADDAVPMLTNWLDGESA